jgi:hypothetical protein
MTDPLAITLSAIALTISATTAWLTLFRRGTVEMSQPTVIYFGPDAPRSRGGTSLPKVFLRTLLFATSKRGRIIESLHVALSRSETNQNFNIWVYGDDNLVRGSGLFVGETGIAANHHFLTPGEDNAFRFIEGVYRLNVFARILGEKSKKLLFSHSLEISRETALRLQEPGTGLYFDWGPDSARYIPHVEKRMSSPDVGDLTELLGIAGKNSTRD